MKKSIPNLTVKKFGGTSLADSRCIVHVAEMIKDSYKKKEPMAIVVSAMSKTTDHLKDLIDRQNISKSPHPESDVVLCSGEQISAGLLSMTLQEMGVPAQSWMGWQIPITTTDHAQRAHITHIETKRILDQIEKGIVPIVCGFQGVTEKGNITTLGRGGSDTTAVALAAHLGAKTCQIFTDVHGIYTADPSRIYGTRRYEHISYDDMLILSKNGANVLHPQSVLQAQKSGVRIQVLSTWNNHDGGTYVDSFALSQRGIAFKEACQWLLPNISEHKIQDIYHICHFYDIPILHWGPSPSGLSFMIWKEHESILVPLIKSHSKELDILTILGLSDGEKEATLSKCAPHIERYFSHPKYFMLVSEKKHSTYLMKEVHKTIDAYFTKKNHSFLIKNLERT